MEIKVQKKYGKSRCDVKQKKKQFLRPRCKIAVKKSVDSFKIQTITF